MVDTIIRRIKMKEDMTKKELIQAIQEKTKRAKGVAKTPFNKLLKRSTKAELKRIRRVVRVSQDGYDISFV